MRQKIKKFVGRTVSFFDKNGGILDLSLTYRRDWMDVDDFYIVEARKKDFIAQDTQTGRKTAIRYSKVFEANKEGIVFN